MHMYAVAEIVQIEKLKKIILGHHPQTMSAAKTTSLWTSSHPRLHRVNPKPILAGILYGRPLSEAKSKFMTWSHCVSLYRYHSTTTSEAQ